MQTPGRGESLVLAALRLSLKANEAERPWPHPHPRSWLKLQLAPPSFSSSSQSWLIWTCAPWLLTPRMAWKPPLVRGPEPASPGAPPTPSLLSGAKLRGHCVTDCPHLTPAC